MRRRIRRERDALTVPEGVALTLPVAGLGVRWAAQTTDIFLTLLALVACLMLLVMTDAVAPNTLFAVGALLFFLIRVPYYVLTELAWNGQTLGKRFLRIKVVSQDGGPLTTHALVLRNLMKEAEIFLPATLILTLNEASPVASLAGLAWVAMTLAIPFFNPRRQRLGDLMAGTYVIHLPDPVLLKDLAADRQPAPLRAEGFTFLSHHLDHYGAYELQTLEGLLRVEDRARSPAEWRARQATLAAVVDKIRTKISYADPVAVPDQQAFLRAFYNAQRAHLEQKQLFGERRADKFHHLDRDDEDRAGRSR